MPNDRAPAREGTLQRNIEVSKAASTIAIVSAMMIEKKMKLEKDSDCVFNNQVFANCLLSVKVLPENGIPTGDVLRIDVEALLAALQALPACRRRSSA